MFAEDCCGHEQSWEVKRMFAEDCCGHEQSWEVKRMFAEDCCGHEQSWEVKRMFAEDCCGHEQSWEVKAMLAGDWWPSGTSACGTQSQSPDEDVLYYQNLGRVIGVTYNIGVQVAIQPDVCLLSGDFCVVR